MDIDMVPGWRAALTEAHRIAKKFVGKILVQSIIDLFNRNRVSFHKEVEPGAPIMIT